MQLYSSSVLNSELVLLTRLLINLLQQLHVLMSVKYLDQVAHFMDIGQPWPPQLQHIEILGILMMSKLDQIYHQVRQDPIFHNLLQLRYSV